MERGLPSAPLSGRLRFSATPRKSRLSAERSPAGIRAAAAVGIVSARLVVQYSPPTVQLHIATRQQHFLELFSPALDPRLSAGKAQSQPGGKLALGRTFEFRKFDRLAVFFR